MEKPSAMSSNWVASNLEETSKETSLILSLAPCLLQRLLLNSKRPRSKKAQPWSMRMLFSSPALEYVTKKYKTSFGGASVCNMRVSTSERAHESRFVRKNALGQGARVAQPVDTEIEMRTLAYGIAGLGHGWGTLNYFTFGCLPDYVVR